MKRTLVRTAVLLALILGLATVEASDLVDDLGPTGSSETSEISPAVLAGGSYSTGFEAAEGYVAGFLGPQGGWFSFGSLVDPIISSANPSAGAQHLRLTGDPLLAQNTIIGAASPLLTPAFAPGETVIFSVDMNISATNGADYLIEMADTNAGTISARVDFFWADMDGDGIPGDILVVDPDGPNQVGAGFVFTGAEHIPGTYANFRIVNTLGGGLTYYYNGSLIYSDPNGLAPFGGSTSLDEVAVFSDNFQFGDVGDFDQFVVEFDVQIDFDSNKTDLIWPATSALSYNVYRGLISSLVDADADGLPDGGYGVCRNATDPNLTDTIFNDPELPAARDGFFYLVTFDDAAGEKGFGITSSGQPRTVVAACP